MDYSGYKASVTERLHRLGKNIAAGALIAEGFNESDSFRVQSGPPLDTGDTPAENVLFEIGSITKIFTGLLVAYAILEHKIEATSPIGELLPDLPLHNTTAAITVEQLATHTSGLPRSFSLKNPSASGVLLDKQDPNPLSAFLKSYVAPIPPPRPAEYSNVGFAVIGAVLENIYQRSFDELLREKITAPLRLTDTSLTVSGNNLSRFATPHSGTCVVKRRGDRGVFAPAGGIISTLSDLVTFVRFLFTDRVSPIKNAWHLASQPHENAILSGGKLGLGVNVSVDGGDIKYSHSGATTGFRSYIEWSMKSKRGVVAWVNNTLPDIGPVLQSTVPVVPLLASRGSAFFSSPVTSSCDYVGVFALSDRRILTVVNDANGQIHVRFPNSPYFRLSPAGTDRFHVGNGRIEFRFTRTDGEISGVAIVQNGTSLSAPRLEKEAPPALFQSPRELQAYTGTYKTKRGLPIQIENKGTALYIKIGTQPPLPLFSSQPDRFICEIIAASILFDRDATGAIANLIFTKGEKSEAAVRSAN